MSRYEFEQGVATLVVVLGVTTPRPVNGPSPLPRRGRLRQLSLCTLCLSVEMLFAFDRGEVFNKGLQHLVLVLGVVWGILTENVFTTPITPAV